MLTADQTKDIKSFRSCEWTDNCPNESVGSRKFSDYVIANEKVGEVWKRVCAMHAEGEHNAS